MDTNQGEESSGANFDEAASPKSSETGANVNKESNGDESVEIASAKLGDGKTGDAESENDSSGRDDDERSAHRLSPVRSSHRRRYVNSKLAADDYDSEIPIKGATVKTKSVSLPSDKPETSGQKFTNRPRRGGPSSRSRATKDANSAANTPNHTTATDSGAAVNGGESMLSDAELRAATSAAAAAAAAAGVPVGGEGNGLYGTDHNMDICNACGGGGDMICCELCPAAYHLLCVDPPLDTHRMPEGDWFCRQCRAKHLPMPKTSSPLLSQLLLELEHIGELEFFVPPTIAREIAVLSGAPVERVTHSVAAHLAAQKAGRATLGGKPALFEQEEGDVCAVCDNTFQCDREAANAFRSRSAEALLAHERRGNQKIRCRVCMRFYHLFCLDPPLLRKPAVPNSWTCAQCYTPSREQEQRQAEITAELRTAARATAVRGGGPHVPRMGQPTDIESMASRSFGPYSTKVFSAARLDLRTQRLLKQKQQRFNNAPSLMPHAPHQWTPNESFDAPDWDAATAGTDGRAVYAQFRPGAAFGPRQTLQDEAARRRAEFVVAQVRHETASRPDGGASAPFWMHEPKRNEADASAAGDKSEEASTSAAAKQSSKSRRKKAASAAPPRQIVREKPRPLSKEGREVVNNSAELAARLRQLDAQQRQLIAEALRAEDEALDATAAAAAPQLRTAETDEAEFEAMAALATICGSGGERAAAKSSSAQFVESMHAIMDTDDLTGALLSGRMSPMFVQFLAFQRLCQLQPTIDRVRRVARVGLRDTMRARDALQLAEEVTAMGQFAVTERAQQHIDGSILPLLPADGETLVLPPRGSHGGGAAAGADEEADTSAANDVSTKKKSKKRKKDGDASGAPDAKKKRKTGAGDTDPAAHGTASGGAQHDDATAAAAAAAIDEDELREAEMDKERAIQSTHRPIDLSTLSVPEADATQPNVIAWILFPENPSWNYPLSVYGITTLGRSRGDIDVKKIGVDVVKDKARIKPVSHIHGRLSYNEMRQSIVYRNLGRNGSKLGNRLLREGDLAYVQLSDLPIELCVGRIVLVLVRAKQ